MFTTDGGGHLLKLKTKLSTSMTSTQFDNGNGVTITYRDLVREYVRLSQTAGPFAQVPHGRYINFMSDFMAAEQSATRAQAIRAWTTLKALDVPKDYRSWKRFRSSKAKQESTSKAG